MSQYAAASELSAALGAAAYVEGLSDSEMNTALERTALPLTTVPASLKQACIHIAAWYLASARGFDTGSVGNAARVWHEWLQWLAGVATGKVALPGVTGTETTTGARVSTSEPRGW